MLPLEPVRMPHTVSRRLLLDDEEEEAVAVGDVAGDVLEDEANDLA